MKVEWEWLAFGDLGVERLYQILASRQRVFVTEQKIVCLDADGLDPMAMHLLGRQGNQPEVKGYLRVLPPGGRYREHSIGRVLTLPEVRGQGLGRQLMLQGLKRIQASFGNVSIRMSAQLHLEAFYKSFGFSRTTDIYDEEGIPHVGMLKKA